MNNDTTADATLMTITIERELLLRIFVETVRPYLAAPEDADDLAREFLARVERRARKSAAVLPTSEGKKVAKLHRSLS